MIFVSYRKEQQITEKRGSKIPISTSMGHASGLGVLLTAVTRDEIGIVFPILNPRLFASMVQKYKVGCDESEPIYFEEYEPEPSVSFSKIF